MATLTAAQTTALAENFQGMAQTVDSYLKAASSKLPVTEKQTLGSLYDQLLDYSDDLYTASANLAMNDVASSLKIINDTTSQINETVSKLQDVQKVINIITACVQLGTAIFTENPAAIGGAIKNLVQACK